MLVQKFIQLEKISLQEFVDRIKSTAKVKTTKSGNTFLDISTRKQHWIYLIENNKLVCPVTGKKVSYCSYDRLDAKNHNTPPSFHYNFYSEDGELFSIDHKLPISQGGSKTNVNNVQPMVWVENIGKSNQLIYL